MNQDEVNISDIIIMLLTATQQNVIMTPWEYLPFFKGRLQSKMIISHIKTIHFCEFVALVHFLYLSLG